VIRRRPKKDANHRATPQGPPIFLLKGTNAMCARHETLDVVLEMLEEGIPEDAIPTGLAAYAAVAGLVDADLPFAVAE
jgi:hypothetical protein